MSNNKVLKESELLTLQPSQPLPRIIHFCYPWVSVLPIPSHPSEGSYGVEVPETWGRGECHRISAYS